MSYLTNEVICQIKHESVRVILFGRIFKHKDDCEIKYTLKS